ncbi:MAG: hypothetical protein FWC53_04150 [Firmicutes bacterium]|nr:hypothetical protein [Bacillota bacterium]
MFDNTIHTGINNQNVANMDYSSLVTSKYNIQDVNPGKYDIDVKIPEVKIDGDIPAQINDNIYNTYVPKLMDIAKNSKVQAIYHISYAAYVNYDILSIVIKLTIKENGITPQRVAIQTINYDLANKKLLGISDVITLKNLNKDDMQSKIDSSISDKAKQIEQISNVTLGGGNLYQRNLSDDMYKVDSTKYFFLGENGYLYIFYPYGNNNFTSDVDIVIF